MIPLLLSAVVGSVLLVEGNTIKIDKGLIDGLRAGDAGIVYYTLTIAGEKKRIEVCRARVAEVNDFTAMANPVDDKSGRLTQDPGSDSVKAPAIRAGYLVELETPENRASPGELAKIARQRAEEERFDEALRYLKKIQELLPDDAFVGTQIQNVEERKQLVAWKKEELKKLDYYRAAAKELLDRGDIKTSRNYVEKILAVNPSDASAHDLLQQIDDRTRTPADMLLIPEGMYEIGLDFKEAKFYNQQPRFKGSFQAFWIDRRVVSTALSFAEAENHCRSLGKRLPTEFEWEAAMQQAGIERDPSVSEWTASWYQPYPGNVIWEEDYGEKFKVLRGREDIRKRFFMDPDKKSNDVVFRCACEAAKLANRRE